MCLRKVKATQAWETANKAEGDLDHEESKGWHHWSRKISGIYMENCHKFDILELTACADIDRARAEEQVAKYHIPNVYTTEEPPDPEIELVINLTIPALHAQIMLDALQAGKHVYVEKPLGVTREEGKAVLDMVVQRTLVGCAPETFLGAGIQTALKLIEDGRIGNPIARPHL